MSHEFEDKDRVETVRLTMPSGEKAGGNFFQQVGGSPAFEKLAAAFYEGVATDDVLRPMYPEDDLGPAARRLQLFLEQYWGGPSTYQEERGHPRLRMRHAAFKINPLARERWLLHMRAALESLELAPQKEAEFWAYLDRAATAMLNTFED